MDYDWFTTLHRLKKDVIDFLEHSSVMMKCVACQMHLIEFLLPERTDVVYSLLFSIAATIYNHSEYSACASRLTQIYRALHNMDDPGEQNRQKKSLRIETIYPLSLAFLIEHNTSSHSCLHFI